MQSGISERFGQTGQGAVLRKARSTDARSISALLRLAFQEFEPLYTPEAFLATVQPESGILKRMEEGPVWVAEDAEGIIGTVSAVRAESAIMIRGMAVDPRARGLKIGKAFLDLTETFAHEAGLDRMSLYTTGFLLSAIRLYQSSGFAFTGRNVSPHGTELLQMMKILDGVDRRA